MPFMVSRRRLEDGDYDAWETRFEDGANDRKAAGCRSVRRFLGSEDRHELMMIFEWDSIENALAYVAKKVEENPDSPKHAGWIWIKPGEFVHGLNGAAGKLN